MNQLYSAHYTITIHYLKCRRITYKMYYWSKQWDWNEPFCNFYINIYFCK